jgi:hypothetical protein
MEDPTCHKEHEDIKQDLHDLKQLMEFHTGEVHASLLPREQILTKDEAIDADRTLGMKIEQVWTDGSADRAEIHRQLDEMAEVVLGVPHKNIDGMITRTGGMKAMVADNENGGIKFKWAKEIITAMVAIIIAFIGLVGTVVNHTVDTNQVIEDVNEQLDERLNTIIGELEQIEIPTTVP